MIKKILKYVGITVACLVAVVLLSASLYRKYLQHKVAEERAITSPNGITSLTPLRIGDIDQWVEVRGQNVNNPILLFIHGGPGIAFIPLAGAWQASRERYFTVVQWDQRGAGKTYASNEKELQRRTMNVSQMETIFGTGSKGKRSLFWAILGEVHWIFGWLMNIRSSFTRT